MVVDRPYYRLRQDIVALPDGTVIPEWYVRLDQPSAMIFAMDSSRAVVMIRIYRYATGETLWELPSGGVAPEADPAAVAIAELREETGFVTPSAERLGQFYFEPARSAAPLYLFFTDAITPGPRTSVEAAETTIETVLVPLPDLIAMLKRGEIAGGPTALALYHTLTLKQLWDAA